MRISTAEQHAIRQTIEYGARFGYGNLIAHLETAWARMMMEKHGFDEPAARRASRGDGYPFALQDDLLKKEE